MGTLAHTADSGTRRFPISSVELVAEARSRCLGQKQFARPLARGGRHADCLNEWLDRSVACISTLARPEIVLKPLRADPMKGGILVGGSVPITGDDLRQDLENGGSVTGYLLTLGYSQSNAFDWLQRDYAAHHIQSELSREALFALGRKAFRLQRAETQGSRLRRIPVQQDHCGARQAWAPEKVQALLALFDGCNPGVRVTDTGFFQPLHSLLGVTMTT